MKLRTKAYQSFHPPGSDEESALRKTTHLGIGAHPDDLEILAINGILQCYDTPGNSFTGVTVTGGGGTPRTGPYANHSDAALIAIRTEEQRKASIIGHYGCQLMLGYGSAEVKDPHRSDLVSDLARIIDVARPSVMYTHNPFDKHDTHVAVACRAIEALRSLPADARPERVYGVEVWRDLDWLPDDAKVVFDCSAQIELQLALINAFASQVEGAKRYDRAVMGRRAAHATYLDPHAPDSMTHAVYGIDMTALLSEELNLHEWVDATLERFSSDVAARVARFAGNAT